MKDRRKKRPGRWRKLDNAAQAFPAATGKKDSRVFRFYCMLREEIDRDRLQAALDGTLEKYPLFRSVLRKGVFWFYMEPRDLAANVKEEDRPPCSRIYVPDQKRLLFEVSYYKNRINLEVFHGLTDGTGAMEFLKELVQNYLILTYPDRSFPEPDGGADLTESDYEEDSFSQYYTGRKSRGEKARRAFQLTGERLEQSEMEITEMILSASEVHKRAREHGVSVTAYLAAILLYSIYEEMPKSGLKKPASLMIPVNLRKIFPSETLTNFTTLTKCSVNPAVTPDELDRYIDICKRQLAESLSDTTELAEKLSLSAFYSTNPLMKILPVSLKTFFTKFGKAVSRKTKQTLIISNLGVVRLPEGMEEFVNRFTFNINISKKVPVNIGVVTYNGITAISFTRMIVSTDFEKTFFKMLTELGLEVEISSNLREIPSQQTRL